MPRKKKDTSTDIDVVSKQPELPFEPFTTEQLAVLRQLIKEEVRKATQPSVLLPGTFKQI